MKKIFKVSIVFILSTLILLTSACSTAGDSSTQTEEVKPVLPEFTRGIHRMDATPFENPTEEDYIVRNGEFQYKIISSSSGTSAEGQAKNEFSLLLKRALGQQPVFLSDTSVPTYDENARYISIGRNSYLEKSGIVFDEEAQLELKGNGTKIISKGRNIFILGGSVRGVINAVYNFFRICFDYEQYSKTCIQMDTQVKNLPCLNFDVLDIPDVDENTYTYGPLSKTTPTDTDIMALSNENVTGGDVAKEMKLVQQRLNTYVNLNQIVMQVFGTGHEGDRVSDAHNVMNIWSKSKTLPDGTALPSTWYAQSGYQMCYSAHGDEAELKRMLDFGVQEMIKDIMRYPVAKYPSLNYIYLGQEDNGGNCLCVDCVEISEKDGSPAGMEIRAANYMIREIRKWMDAKDEYGNYINEEYRRPNFKMVIMAYGTSRIAPTHYDEKLGKNVLNPGCEIDEDVIIQIVGQSSPSHAIYHDANKSSYTEQNKWVDVTPGLWVWNHAFHHYNLAFFADIANCFSSERFQWWANGNASHLFNEIGGGYDYGNHWYDMYIYIFFKLSWNSTLVTGDLIKDFCEAYYGPAAETMMKLFYEQQHYHQLSAERHKIDVGSYWPQGNQFWTEIDYPYPVVKYQLDFVDKALEDIKIVLDSKDPDKYYVYKERLDIFSVSLIYIIKDIYSKKAFKPYSNEEWIGYRNRAIEVLDTHRISAGRVQMTADSFRAL